MDGESPLWNEHKSHNSSVPYDAAGEHQESHDLLGDDSASGEPLSSYMSGAIKALLPDYHENSPSITTTSVEYPYSLDNHCLKPGTRMDDNIAGEKTDSVKHLLPLRCDQYVPQEKDQEIDQGNCNWTSVLQDTLEMSNGVEMEQTLSMGVCVPMIDLNPIYKGPDTEAKFAINDHNQIAEARLIKGQGGKGELDSFFPVVSDGSSPKKGVLEMGNNEKPVSLDAVLSVEKEELEMTGIREYESGLLPGFNNSLYSPFSSSGGFLKSKTIPLVTHSFEPTLHGATEECEKPCKDVSPIKNEDTNNSFNHSKVNNESVHRPASVYGLHHLDLQKVTDGKTSVESHDHSSEHDVQDEKADIINLEVSKSTVIKQTATCLPKAQYLESKLETFHDHVPVIASVSSQNAAMAKCENLEHGTSESTPSEPERVEKVSIKTNNAEPDLKVETKIAIGIYNSSSGTETIQDQPFVSDKNHTDIKCKDSGVEQWEKRQLNELCLQENNSKNTTLILTSTPEKDRDECEIHVQEKQTQESPSAILLPFEKNEQNSEKSEKNSYNVTSESSIPPPIESIKAAPSSPTSWTDCSSQNNMQKTLQMHKKRKRKRTELEQLFEPMHSKKEDCPVYESDILDTPVKPGTTGCERANPNNSLSDQESSALKEGDNTNDANSPSSKRKSCHSQLEVSQLELVTDPAETSQKQGHSCSEATQEKMQSNARVNRKAGSKRKLKKRRKLHLKVKSSDKPEEDYTSHSKVSKNTLVKEGSNPTVTQEAISSLESSAFSEHGTDLVDFEIHQKVTPTIKVSKDKKDKHEASPLNTQSSLDSTIRIDPVLILETESSDIQNNLMTLRQRKRVDIKPTIIPNVCPQEDTVLPTNSKENLLTSDMKTVTGKRSVKKGTKKDDNETTPLDIEPFTATPKQTDPVSTAETEAESSAVLRTQRKSPKKKMPHTNHEAIHLPAADQTPQLSVLNKSTEPDSSIAQPNKRRFRTRKTFDTVNDNCKPTKHISTADSGPAEESEYSGVSQQTPNKQTPKDIQTIQEIPPFDSMAATEIDDSDDLDQKKTKGIAKREDMKATKHKPHVIRNLRKPDTMQKEYSESINITNSRSEDMTSKCIQKRTLLRNVSYKDHTEHPPVSLGKDLTRSSCIKTDIEHDTAESHEENPVFITNEPSPQSSPMKAKKTRGKHLFNKEEIEQSIVLEPAKREEKHSDVPSAIIEVDSENIKKTVVSQQPVKDGTVVDQNDTVEEETRITVLHAAKTPKTKSQKVGQKKKMLVVLLTHVKEEEMSDDDRIADITESHTRPGETLFSSMQTTDVKDQDNVEQKQGNPLSDKITMFSDNNECNARLGETLTSPMDMTDCEDQSNVEQKPRKRGRPSLNKSTEFSDITECQARLGETLYNPMQTTDCEDHNVEQKPRKRGRPPKKNNKNMIFVAHLEDNISSSVEISEFSSSQDSTEKSVNAAESSVIQKDVEFLKMGKVVEVKNRVRVNKQLGIDTSDSAQSTTDPLSQNSPSPTRKKGKNFEKPIRNLRVSSRLSEALFKESQKANKPSFPQNAIEVFKGEGKTSLSMPGVAENLKLCEKTTVQEGVLADIKIENKVKRRKRGQKRDRIKAPSLDQRLNSKSTEIVKKPLTCKYCGISFRHITAYTVHRRIHTGDKPYKCKICGKTFAQLSKLKSHHNVHTQDTSFPCPCCNRRFMQKKELLCHFKVHLKESKTNSEPQKDLSSKRNALSNVSSETANNYRCLICKKNFVNQDKLEIHMQTHEMEKPLSCKDCGKNFWNPSSLTAHEKTHWPVKPYACSICGKGFNQLKALKKHSQNHAGETPFSCFHCGHAFSDLSALRMHQASKTCIARKNVEANSNIEGFIVSQGVDGQVNTPVFFKCQICKQLFRKWCQYTLHLQTHTSSPPYICFSCGQCYETDSEMNVHCKVCCQSSGEEKICGTSLSEITQGVSLSSKSLPSTGTRQNSQMPTSSERLAEPVQTNNKVLTKLPEAITIQLPIKLPSNQLPTPSEVISASRSSSPSLWNYKCSSCGQRFKQYKSLSVHLQTHAAGFRYTCTHCGQFFESWSKLWLHQRRHRLKNRSFSCNQCNLQFRFFGSFKEHMIDHAGHSPYVCTVCPKTFTEEASLHAHQCESHNLRTSLKCDVCSKTFSNLSNLIKHSLLHNGSTSHICLSCNLPFTNSRVLKEHLRTHTNPGPALPDLPLKPLSFPHKCKKCKASFSTGDLLYAHQICHSRDAKTLGRPAVVPTSKSPTTPSTRKNHVSNLNLDSIPDDDTLYLYTHPDKLYVPPSRKVQPPVINLDPDKNVEALDAQNTEPPNNEITSQSDSTPLPQATPDQEETTSLNSCPELPNNEITSQSDSTHLPQATPDQEATNASLNESVKEIADDQDNTGRKYQTRSTFVKRNVDMELRTLAQQGSEESFECADCTEKLTSVLSLYEHYILHALGDTYVH
ncbi:uncharacterized protein si:ch73-347e22.4 [Danio aesculapii]|uniref:uncharacterized protein si:ch73-347e22.4 n=1 Tax=Danio aesculapii TaxID=1142201 RepID=UPI0024C018CF|nr:uncharacterized protein si:ch73-347e22.4 [Danio aesculapii]